ncbi:MAG: DMT family transporter [Candidatus Aenigmarchaeota archaeon]|nr:DMT family transporter [Candidatus Aenigmarchaeota archaeon]
MGMELGIIFGLIAMLGYGLSNGMSQKIVKKEGIVRTAVFRNVFIVLLLLPVLLYFLPASGVSLTFVMIALMIGIVGYVPLVTFYKAIEKGKVGVITPISNSSFLVTILLSVVFFGEILSPSNAFSVLLIVAGIILISVDFRDFSGSGIFRISSGIPIAVLTCFLWGMVFFLLKIPVSVVGPVISSFLLELGVLLVSGINMKFSGISHHLPGRWMLSEIFLVALFGTAGSLFYNLGISVSDVSVVVALSFSSPFIAAVYGRIAYKERLRLIQYVAIIVILSGIFLLSFF